MHERRIDLNLLNVFYAVMTEKSVTRAADRLCMTQPAVSNALRRLRELLKDDLFTKVPGGVQPTEKALTIWPGLRSSLDELRAIAMPAAFEPATVRETFNVAVTDTLALRVIPRFTSHFVAAAPNAKLHFHLHSNPGSTQGIEKGAIDCAVGMFPNFPATLIVEGLASDDYLCVFRRNHPRLNRQMTLDDFLSVRHVLVKQAPWQIGMVDAWLNLRGLKRDIAVIVNVSEQAIDVIRNGDLVAAIPRSSIEASNMDDLEWAPLPFPHEPILYKMAWHERTDHDPARVWLRDLLKRTVAEFFGPSLLTGYPACPLP